MYERVGLGRGVSKRLDAVFGIISSLLLHQRDTVKETTLVSLGNVGKTSDPDILGRVISTLFVQLNQNSILLRGLAYIQVGTAYDYHVLVWENRC